MLLKPKVFLFFIIEMYSCQLMKSIVVKLRVINSHPITSKKTGEFLMHGTRIKKSHRSLLSIITFSLTWIPKESKNLEISRAFPNPYFFNLNM